MNQPSKWAIDQVRLRIGSDPKSYSDHMDWRTEDEKTHFWGDESWKQYESNKAPESQNRPLGVKDKKSPTQPDLRILDATKEDLICAYFMDRMGELMPLAFSSPGCSTSRRLYFAYGTRKDELMAQRNPNHPMSLGITRRD